MLSALEVSGTHDKATFQTRLSRSTYSAIHLLARPLIKDRIHPPPSPLSPNLTKDRSTSYYFFRARASPRRDTSPSTTLSRAAALADAMRPSATLAPLSSLLPQVLAGRS